MKIPDKYINEDDVEVRGAYVKQVQLERWVEDLLAQIQDLKGEIGRLNSLSINEF